ncbi:MAG TPA: aromatic ring-hydroxylating dioxygenase subunit alpha [Chloroflexota bacterium]|nr:aromatic ring-hydroxylating dioxygenase subunit alpha [Chloroflexota bacterium]
MVATAERLRVLHGLHLGLPDYWYAILPSSDLGNRPLGLRRFGQDLVLWRDSIGHPHIFEDRCPHRGARFSALAHAQGRIQGDTFACWYHGWTFDKSGACVAMPYEPEDTPLKRRVQVHTYPAEERAGYIWMYWGQSPTRPLVVPFELEDSRWCGFRTHVIWRTNWLNILDNLSDPLHQYTLHARAYTTRRRPPFNRVRLVEESDEHLRLVQYQADRDGSVLTQEDFGFEIRLPNLLRVELLNAAPGGNVRVVMMMTPIDAENTWVSFFRGRQVSGFARLLWTAFWHLFYRRAVYRVAAQDKEMLTMMGSLAETRLREHLASSDVGVIHLRKLMYRAFERKQHE